MNTYNNNPKFTAMFRLLILRLLSLFNRGAVTNEIYINFIDTGECPEPVLENIALKLILQVSMTEMEKTIFFSETGKIEHIVKKLIAK